MIKLYRFFLFMSLKTWLLYGTIGLTCLLVGSKIFGESLGGLLELLALGMPLAAFFQTLGLYSHNLSWIRGMPLSKIKILGAGYLYNLTQILLVFFTCGIYVGVDFIFDPQSWSKTKKFFLSLLTFETQTSEAFSLSPNMISYIYMWIVLTVYVVFIMHYLSVIQSPPDELLAQKTSFTQKFRKYSKKRMGLAILFLGAMAFLEYTSSSTRYILIIFGAVVVFNVLCTFKAISSIKATRPLVKTFSVISFLVSVFTIASLYQTAHFLLGFDKKHELVGLGPVRRDLSQNEFAQLFYQELDKNKAFHLKTSYLEWYYDEESINLSKGQDPLDLSKAFAQQKDREVLLLLASMAEYRFWKQEHISAFLDQWHKISPETHERQLAEFLNEVVFLFISDDELKTYLKSSNIPKVSLALKYIRMHFKAQFVDVILSQLQGYPDTLRYQSLKTLSVLTGHELGFDWWVEFQQGQGSRTLASIPVDAESLNCEQWKGKQFAEPHNHEELMALNICLRKKVMAKQYSYDLRMLDQHGFIRPPFASSVLSLIKYYLL